MAAGMAATAVLGVSVPLAAHRFGGSASAPGRHRVVVDPPRTDAKGVLTFSGAVDGKAWSVNPEPSGTMTNCLMSLGDCPARTPLPVDPVQVATSEMSGSDDSYIAEFRPDVSALDVFLADGSQWTLQPATIGGRGVAVFKLPHGFRAATPSPPPRPTSRSRSPSTIRTGSTCSSPGTRRTRCPN